MYSYSKFQKNYAMSKFVCERPISKDYRVFVNGEEIPVYTCRISKYPFNTSWPGHQRPFDQTDEASFVNIVSDEDIEIEVIIGVEYKKLLIKPFSKNIKYTDASGKIKFSLTENEDCVLQCDSYHHSLYIFNSKPISAPNRDDVTYYFDAGMHFPGKIVLNSGESVYVDKDALVYGNIYAENAENIHIFGNGIFDDSNEERFSPSCYGPYTNGNMKFYDCKNIKIEGVGMTNSAIWCMNLFGCFDVTLDNIKIFGQWRYNTDGIDVVNCQNIFIKNSFVHSFDDTITIKGIEQYYYIDNKNIHVDNCILWCDWGKCCEVGVETVCREYCDISFKNCDVLRGGNGVLDINNGECAEIYNIVFENINVDYNCFDTIEIYQENDDMIYDKQDVVMIPRLVLFGNLNWRTSGFYGMQPPLECEINLDGIESRNIHDVTVRNINVYYDDNMPLKDGKPDIQIIIENTENTKEFYNINVSDIFVNGKKIL